MAFKIVISPLAQKEIENAIDYYLLYSSDAPKIFLAMLHDAYKTSVINLFIKYDTKISGA